MKNGKVFGQPAAFFATCPLRHNIHPTSRHVSTHTPRIPRGQGPHPGTPSAAAAAASQAGGDAGRVLQEAGHPPGPVDGDPGSGGAGGWGTAGGGPHVWPRAVLTR